MINLIPTEEERRSFFSSEIKQKRFIDIRTNEIKTSFSILDIRFMKEIKDVV